MTIKAFGKTRSLNRVAMAVYSAVAMAAFIGCDYYGHIMALARMAE